LTKKSRQPKQMGQDIPKDIQNQERKVDFFNIVE
jgi:hypothetical protein